MVRYSTTEATDTVLEKFKNQRGYILVEIPKEGRIVEGKKLHSLLLQDGYIRAATLNKGTVNLLDISEPAQIKKGLPKEAFYIVIDRMQFSDEEKGSLLTGDQVTVLPHPTQTALLCPGTFQHRR